MFRESLLESSQTKKRKRWPMAAAFALEVIVTGLLVLIPLLTTAVIHVSAHVTRIPPLGAVRITQQTPPPGAPRPGGVPAPVVVAINTNNRFTIPVIDQRGDDAAPAPAITVQGSDSSNAIENALSNDRHSTPVQDKTRHHPIVSISSEAQLLKKVEPIYPHIAVLTGKQGDVKLHAYIAKDGTIEILTVLSGDPLLIYAAVDAVKQWRYRPYILNGEPVEVETFITVSFKGIRN